MLHNLNGFGQNIIAPEFLTEELKRHRLSRNVVVESYSC